MSRGQNKSALLGRIEELLDKGLPAAKSGQSAPGNLSRRNFLGMGALAGAAASMGGLASSAQGKPAAPDELVEATIGELQVDMAAGNLTSIALVNFYLARIRTLDEKGPHVNSIIETNPDAKDIALALDAERRKRGPRGPLHGIPILLKDNIDTADRMQTAAGSLALVGTPALQDSTVAARLRAAGAVILGKTNLSEWANFRSSFSSSGWSGRGGQCNNPYALDRNPCGSSSGSAAATSANFTAASMGTETDGSIVCPANANGVVGIKPTVGLVSRAGVVPISHTQDTVGPHGRTVADAATVLGALTGVDPRDPATSKSAGKFFTDYTQFLNPDGLQGARIGVARMGVDGSSPHLAAVFDDVLTAMRDAGATLIDVDFPHQDDINSGVNEFTVLLYDFKGDLQKYLATRVGVPVAGGTLADVIAFDNAHADQELKFFGQDVFELSETFDITDPNKLQPLGVSYNDALANDVLFGATDGIDFLLQQNNLDAIVSPTAAPPWPTDLINGDHDTFGSSSPAAIVGYPIINVPMGFTFGDPVGISFMGTAFSEPTLIKLASGFEHVVQARRPPQFLPTLPLEGGVGHGKHGKHGKANTNRPRLM